jgi:hypothetical protein
MRASVRGTNFHPFRHTGAVYPVIKVLPGGGSTCTKIKEYHFVGSLIGLGTGLRRYDGRGWWKFVFRTLARMRGRQWGGVSGLYLNSICLRSFIIAETFIITNRPPEMLMTSMRVLWSKYFVSKKAVIP